MVPHSFLGAQEAFCGVVQVAYVPQSAFIYNATVRENILFGQPYDEAQYQTALNAASLAPDLAILPGVAHAAMVHLSSPGLSTSCTVLMSKAQLKGLMSL